MDPDERPLVPVEAHLESVLARISPLRPRHVVLSDAWGCVIASDAVASEDLPAFATSAVDGFAIRTGGHSEFRVVGAVHMGRLPDVVVAPTEAVAVPTGGVVPDGADAVVPIESCVIDDDRMRVRRPVRPQENVRPEGEDVEAGSVVIDAGRRLFGPELGVLASTGCAEVSVFPRARVGVLSTGDELVRPGATRTGAQIYDANAFTLIGALREMGAVPVDAGIVPDRPLELIGALNALAGEVDAIVCSGGVSMGDRDPVKDALADAVTFTEVAMQPGKPQAFGEWAGKPFFGLPGNTVSAFVSFEMFVRPALLKMMGRTDERPTVDACFDGTIDGPARKVRLVRVRARRERDRWVAIPVGGHRSNLLASLAMSNGLAMIPAGCVIRRGETCVVRLLREPS